MTDDETTQTVLQTAALLEELGHHDRAGRRRPCRTRSRTTSSLYWSAARARPERGGQAHLQPHLRPQPERQPDQGTGPARGAGTPGGCRWRSPGCNRSHRHQQEVLRRPRRGAHPDAVADHPRARLAEPVAVLRDRDRAGSSSGSRSRRSRTPPATRRSRCRWGRRSKGLPIGVQLAAAQGYDRRLLEVAYELEAGPAVRADPGLSRRRVSACARRRPAAPGPTGRPARARRTPRRRRRRPRPGPSVVSRVAGRPTRPTGGRTTCTVSSVFMKFHSAGSRAAEAPEAESTQVSSRCSGVISSPGTSGTRGRIQTTAGPGPGHRTLDPAPLHGVEVAAATTTRAGPRGDRRPARAPGVRRSHRARPVRRPGKAHAWARATTRPDSSLSSAWRSETVRPGRSTDAVTDSSPTGTGPSRSIVNRPSTRGVPSSIDSRARPSSAAGGPPCWACGAPGPGRGRGGAERRRPRGS